PWLFGSDAEEWSGWCISGHAWERRGERNERISCSVAGVEKIGAEVIAVVADEAPPAVVVAHAVLAAARFETEFKRARIEPKIARAEFLRREVGPLRAADHSAIS